MLFLLLWVLFFIMLLLVQAGNKEGLTSKPPSCVPTSCPPLLDLDKLSGRLDKMEGKVLDLSLNMTQLNKNVANLMDQQNTFSTNLKNSAAAIPNVTVNPMND